MADLLAVHLLGPEPHVVWAGQPQPPPRGRKVWALLAYLLTTESAPSRGWLAELLFCDADDPLNALSWNLTQLRRLLGHDSSVAGEPVVVRLPPGTFVDVQALTAGTWRQAIGIPGLGRELLEGMTFSACPGFDAWLLASRRRLSGAAENVLREAARAQLSAGDGARAVELISRIVVKNPLDEDAQELLIRAYVASGDRAAAQIQRDACVALFRRELGTDPGIAVLHAADPQPQQRAFPGSPASRAVTLARLSSPVLVGRSQELARLEAACQRAIVGRPAVVLIAGEAGVGKSRLVGEFAGRAERSGARVLLGGCVALDEGGLPWAAVVDALRGLVRSVEPQVLDALLGSARDELGRLLPELGRPRAEPEQVPVPDSDAAHARLLELLLDLFGRLSREAPLVLVFEDLHWADRASRDLVAFLSRRLRSERLLLVLTFRSDELGRGHRLRPLLAELGRSERVDRVDLRPFDRADLSALLDAILDAPASAGLAEEIFARSDGNPFFAEELLAAWRESEHTGERPGLPGSMRDTLLARVERLSGSARTVLAAAATAGRRVDHRLLAVVSGLAEPQLTEAVRETVAEHVLLADPDGRGLTFRHALMWEAVQAELLPGERVRLHAELAAAITAHRDWTYGTEASVAAELAYHWDAALDVERALPAAVEAGRAAERVYAFANAARHFERAVALWDRVPDAAALVGLDRAGVLARAAEAVYRTDDQTRAVALQRAAVAAVDGAAEPVRAALLQERLGRFLWVAGDPDTLAAYAKAVGMLAHASPSAERAGILAAYARVLLLVSRAQEARAVAERALAMARAVGARFEEGRARVALGTSLTVLGDPQAGLGHLYHARAVAEELVDIDGIGWSWIGVAEAVAVAGRLTDGLTLALEGSEIMRRLGMANMYGDFLQGVASDLEFRLGRWADADRRSREVVERGQAASVKGIFLRLWRARLLVARGDLPEAHLMLDQVQVPVVRSQAPPLGEVRARALAELALAEGRFADAASAARDGIVLTSAAEPRSRVALAALGLRALAEKAAALRDRKAAEALQALQDIGGQGDDLLARAQEADAARPGGVLVPESAAWLRQCHAEHARLHGRADPAAWADTAAGWDPLAEPYPAAYARLRHAEALLSTRAGKAETAGPLRAAAQAALRLGARPLLTEIDRLARRARIPLEPPKDTPPAPAAAPFGLTPRELEVLAHVAEGHTNRGIAKALFVTEKTAGFHVSGILSKLGVSNRSEAAAVAHRLGLLADANKPGETNG